MTFTLVCSAIVLIIHFLAIKLTCDAVGLALKANSITSSAEKNIISRQISGLHQYSEILSSIFIVLSLVFILILGVMLIIGKIRLFPYVMGVVIFGLIQSGIYVLVKFINIYGMTEIFGRLYVLLHLKLTVALFVLPIFVYALKSLVCLLKRRN